MESNILNFEKCKLNVNLKIFFSYIDLIMNDKCINS